MRSTALSFSFLQMREVRPRKAHNLPKVWRLGMNDSILTPESPFSQPQHSPASCEISRRGTIQKKTKIKPREMILSGKTVPNAWFFFFFWFFYFPIFLTVQRCLEQQWFKTTKKRWFSFCIIEMHVCIKFRHKF